MKYQKKVSLGSWLKKGEDVKDGDLITIANEGKKTTGEYGEQDVFLMKTGDKEGNISINQTSINNWIDAFGDDSINWIGKEVKVMVVKQNVQGKIRPVYYFLHPDTILDDESGEFIIPNKSKEAIPVIENDDPNAEAQITAEEERE
jgi:hypothetical protein